MLYAYDRGVNLLFFSVDLHHFLYSRMASAIRTLCRSGAAERDNVVLVAVTYIKQPDMLESTLFDLFAELGIDYVDLFLWGWLSRPEADKVPTLLNTVQSLRGPNSHAQQFLSVLFGASERMQRMGAVRYVGMSFHDTKLAASTAMDIDAVMVRVNAAHTHAEERVLAPLIGVEPRPGTIGFNATRGESGPLWQPPPKLPEDCWVPTPGDCYRYALSCPTLDVCLMGPRNRSDIDAALEAVAKGDLSTEERLYLQAYGQVHRGRAAPGTLRGHQVRRQE